jgi:glycerol-3-phosphate O-acyltransferase
MHAALQAEHSHVSIIPTAVAYDVVLEDHVLARQGVKRVQRAFSRELAEMVRYAVGYKSRAFVTFGKPMSVKGIDPNSRRAVLDLCHEVMERIGRQYKVLPSAVVASSMRPSITMQDLTERSERLIESLRAAGANMGVSSGAEAVASAVEILEARGVVVVADGRVRVRDRNVLRYYGRGLDHLLARSRRTH